MFLETFQGTFSLLKHVHGLRNNHSLIQCFSAFIVNSMFCHYTTLLYYKIAGFDIWKPVECWPFQEIYLNMCMCMNVSIFDHIVLMGVAQESEYPSLYSGSIVHTCVTLDTLLNLFLPHLPLLYNWRNDRIYFCDNRMRYSHRVALKPIPCTR